MNSLYSFSFISRIIFLLLTPIAFRALNFAFIWHSIYWGTITIVVLIWGILILVTPLFGRIGCGWICFMGTIQDLASRHSLFYIKWRKPILWTRILFLCAFFTTSFIFLFTRLDSGKISGIKFEPWFLNMDFNTHYKHIWLYDTLSAVLLGLLLERRWVCRNFCFIGSLCAIGASRSKLIPVVNTQKCNLCGKCEEECLVRIPIKDYIINKHGLVTDSECIICGKCVESCNQEALKVKFIWNRKKYIQQHALIDKKLTET